MAEALHIDRDRLFLSPPDRRRADGFWTMVKRRAKKRAGRLHHRAPRLLEHRPPRRPRRARSTPGFRGADRLRNRAFRRHRRRRSESSISALGPGTLLLAALDVWPEATGSASTSRAARYPMRPPMRAAWASRSGSSSSSAIGRQGSKESFDLILCNPPYVAEGAELGPGVREYEPDEALFAGESGLDAYRALAPQLPRLLNQGGLAAVEIGHDQAEPGHGASGPRRACRAGSPTTSPTGRAPCC